MKMNDFKNVKGEAWLVYDDQCPICRNYVKRVRFKESVGELHLIDARKPSEHMDEITRAGLDIDQGMVLKFNDQLYYGSDAIYVLTLLTTRSNFFNKLNYVIFSNRMLASIFYPICKFYRNMLLIILGIPFIKNLEK